MENPEEVPGSIDVLKRKSEDVGWEYGELADPTMKKIKCKLCNMVFTGGVYRLKQHIAHIKGNVAPCGKSTPVDQVKCKCKQALEAVKKKDDKREMLAEVRSEVNINASSKTKDDKVVEIDGFRKQVQSLGPMDQFARSISSPENRRQRNINESLFKSRTNEVHTYLARWVYVSGISFNSINNDAFRQFVEAIGHFGPG